MEQLRQETSKTFPVFEVESITDGESSRQQEVAGSNERGAISGRV